MINFINRFCLIIIISIAIFCFSSCSSTYNIVSSYNKSIVIDGKQSDWQKNLEYDKENNINVGFCNDSNNLYIAVITAQRFNTMKILRLGLTIWLESEQSDKKIGIRFPHKLEEQDMPVMRNKSMEELASAEDMTKMLEKLITKQDEITIVNADNFPLYAYKRNSREGVSAGLAVSMGQLVYELKVPLAENNMAPFVFNASPGETIYVEIESGEFERSKTGSGISQPSGQNPGGGMRSGRSGGRVGSGTDQVGNISGMAKRIGFKSEVKLALEP